MQLLVAEADLLETLSITNWPNEMVQGGVAFDDTWISSLIEANSLPNIRELSIRCVALFLIIIIVNADFPAQDGQ